MLEKLCKNLISNLTNTELGLNIQDNGHHSISTDHFNEGVCNNVSCSVQILEKIEGSDRTEMRAIDT